VKTVVLLHIFVETSFIFIPPILVSEVPELFHMLSLTNAEQLVHAFMTSRLPYWVTLYLKGCA